MSRDKTVQARLNKREHDYLKKLSDRLDVSMSEAIRIIIFDSRFLYSEGVDFGDINISSEDLVPEEDSPTTGNESVERVFNS